MPEAEPDYVEGRSATVTSEMMRKNNASARSHLDQLTTITSSTDLELKYQELDQLENDEIDTISLPDM